MVNPFPLARGRGRRVAAHRNPMEPFQAERTGLYRPKLARRRPRQIPDEKFGELFAALGSHRDRALAAFWVSRADLDALLAAAPSAVAGQAGEQNRRRGIGIMLDWLQAQPGATWQQRWQASGAGQDGRADWRAFPVRWRAAAMPPATAWDGRVVTAGLLSLICADVIRPDISWLLTTATPKRLAAEMARTRDPAGSTS